MTQKWWVLHGRTVEWNPDRYGKLSTSTKGAVVWLPLKVLSWDLFSYRISHHCAPSGKYKFSFTSRASVTLYPVRSGKLSNAGRGHYLDRLRQGNTVWFNTFALERFGLPFFIFHRNFVETINVSILWNSHSPSFRLPLSLTASLTTQPPGYSTSAGTHKKRSANSPKGTCCSL